MTGSMVGTRPLGRRPNASSDRPKTLRMTQESPHLGGPQFGGVPQATETDEPLGPVDIGGFGAPAQMLAAQVGLQ